MTQTAQPPTTQPTATPPDTAGSGPTEDRRWRLSPSAALRPEPFGALAYDFVSRRLTFLKTPMLVDVVRALDGERTVGEALTTAGVPQQQRAGYRRALGRLAEAGLVVPD